MAAPAALLADPFAAENLREERRRTGTDKWDEVWDGRYVFMPPRWNWEASAVGTICYELSRSAEQRRERWRVYPGVNVSDDPRDWQQNYRCPDIAVYLPENPAEERGSHWLGGPDVAVEILSEGDLTLEKLPFYASVGVRELWVLDRDPWRLARYRLVDGVLIEDGVAEPGGAPVRSVVLPLDWSLTADEPPAVRIAAAE